MNKASSDIPDFRDYGPWIFGPTKPRITHAPNALWDTHDDQSNDSSPPSPNAQEDRIAKQPDTTTPTAYTPTDSPNTEPQTGR